MLLLRTDVIFQILAGFSINVAVIFNCTRKRGTYSCTLQV